MWTYANEIILQDLSNVYEKKKRNAGKTKRREEVAFGVATTEVRRLGLYSRLMPEVIIVQLTPYSAWFLDASGLCELTVN